MHPLVRLICLATPLAAACTDPTPGSTEAARVQEPLAERPRHVAARPAVYTLSNELDANRIVVFERAADGALRPGNAYATGGKGSASGLGSQGALVFDARSQEFLAVNAGDNSISRVALEPGGALRPVAHASSGGVKPVSIARWHRLVYVVNAGDATTPANIAGFRIVGDDLEPIAGSTQPLSAAQVGPAQIGFSPDGGVLVVTEKATNLIDTYVVSDGVAGAPRPQRSIGQTPFGFAFAADHLIVSEAFGGGDGLGAASSYAVAGDGTLAPISSAVGTTQSAPCWVVIADDHAYVTNTKSSTISAYAVSDAGELALVDAGGVAATASKGPIDAASDDGFLYALDAGDHAISRYTIAGDGRLTRQPDVTGVSPTAVGLVAR